MNFLEKEGGDPAEHIEAEDWESHHNSLLYQGLDELDDRSQDIIRSRWLTESKQTLQELADKYGVSAERIRQLESNALKKMRAAIAA